MASGMVYYYRCTACSECFFSSVEFVSHSVSVHCKVLVCQGQDPGYNPVMVSSQNNNATTCIQLVTAQSNVLGEVVADTNVAESCSTKGERIKENPDRHTAKIETIVDTCITDFSVFSSMAEEPSLDNDICNSKFSNETINSSDSCAVTGVTNEITFIKPQYANVCYESATESVSQLNNAEENDEQSSGQPFTLTQGSEQYGMCQERDAQQLIKFGTMYQHNESTDVDQEGSGRNIRPCQTFGNVRVSLKQLTTDDIQPYKEPSGGQTEHSAQLLTSADESSKCICSLCNMHVESEADLTKHVKNVHMEDQLYKCFVCSDKYKVLKDLLGHMQFHSSTAKQFECIMCKRKFERRYRLKGHLIGCCRKKSVKRYGIITCVGCQATFLNTNELVRHIYTTHTKKPLQSCRFCKRILTSVNRVKQHERSCRKGVY